MEDDVREKMIDVEQKLSALYSWLCNNGDLEGATMVTTLSASIRSLFDAQCKFFNDAISRRLGKPGQIIEKNQEKNNVIPFPTKRGER